MGLVDHLVWGGALAFGVAGAVWYGRSWRAVARALTAAQREGRETTDRPHHVSSRG